MEDFDLSNIFIRNNIEGLRQKLNFDPARAAEIGSVSIFIWYYCIIAGTIIKKE